MKIYSIKENLFYENKGNGGTWKIHGLPPTEPPSLTSWLDVLLYVMLGRMYFDVELNAISVSSSFLRSSSFHSPLAHHMEPWGEKFL